MPLAATGRLQPPPQPRQPPPPPKQQRSGWSTAGKVLGGAALVGGGALLGRRLVRHARYAKSPYVAASKKIKTEVTDKAGQLAKSRSRAHELVPGLGDATDAVARKKLIRQRMMQAHPDKGGDTGAFQAMSDAVESAYPGWKTAAAMLKVASLGYWGALAEVME